MRAQLQEQLEKRVKQCVQESLELGQTCPKIERKKESMMKRKAEIVKAKATGRLKEFGGKVNEITTVNYEAHFQYLVKHKGAFFIEEEVEERVAEFYKDVLVEDTEKNPYVSVDESNFILLEDEVDERDYKHFKYDRLKAVQYAENWWNSHNPAFKSFEVNCTNYISQCLHAGGGQMRGYPNRGKGWWMRDNNWSYSWSVAHSMRMYLSGSTIGIRAKEVSSPDDLLHGDVICYDFQGDGRYDHTTIVTGHDADGMPLVNANTSNSRKRYWAYEDSTAYTPNIKYKFFTIFDEAKVK
ncbi:amidase domain-containing protein [Cytobacillus purgationiresistens]|uniref:Esterase/lipase n=1 Tax=Cytobacillus purgationiresistens TaxID=863449 RepID=A0ABU0ATK0_9BACI|nr:amidase domain-containing protein [Cytobacillus purgationiresistens]MDQ0273768.1 esterase/lipase [Cytobacillus purgationiresistens]